MENKFSNIKGRVLQVAELYNVSKEKFCKEIGVTYGNFKGQALKTPLNSNAVANILAKYRDINPRWLILGEGDMTDGVNVMEGPPVYGVKNKETCQECRDKEKKIHELLNEKGGYKDKIITLQNELINCKDELLSARHNGENGQKRKAG